MRALTIIADAGLQASVEPSGGLKLKGLSKLSVERKKQIIDYARKHKHEILTALTKGNAIGNCDSCPAAGYWDHMGPGSWCFHRAYFMGKSGRPSPCVETKYACPLGR